MGLFSKKPKETREEIHARIESSDLARTFLDFFAEQLSPNNEWWEYLISDTQKRSIFMTFEKKGVLLEFLNFRRKSDSYKEDVVALGFGRYGFADLPNSDYTIAFKDYIKDNLGSMCKHLEIRDGEGWKIIIKVKESAKISW